MDTLALFRQLVRCGDRDVYVAPTGSDSNAGTESAPYRQVQQALSSALPGDLIHVASGTYGFAYVEQKHGGPQNWIGVVAEPGAHIDVADGTQFSCLGLKGCSYIGVYGLEISGAQDASNVEQSVVMIYGGSHHLAIWGCDIHDVPGGGINCFETDGTHDLLDFSFNTIHDTSKFSPNNTSGISINNSADITGGATWDGHYGYRIVGNYIYNCECTVPFTTGGFQIITDGNGISLDLIFNTHGYDKPILVEGNIITGCGGSAVHVFGCRNVDIFGNTGIGCNRTDSPAISDGAEFDADDCDSTIVVHGNIICPITVNQWRDATSTYTENVVLGSSQVVDGTNIDHKAAGLEYFSGLIADVTVANDLSGFVPGTTDAAGRAAGAQGRQALGNGPRARISWAAGALERPVAPQFLLDKG